MKYRPRYSVRIGKKQGMNRSNPARMHTKSIVMDGVGKPGYKMRRGARLNFSNRAPQSRKSFPDFTVAYNCR